jgi:type III secretion protein F
MATSTPTPTFNGSFGLNTHTFSAIPSYGSTGYVPTRDGLDLFHSQGYLQTQTVALETAIRNLQNATNMSDTEKMFAMQTTMNTWSTITNLRTNVLKSVSDSLKTITRNVA